MKFAITSTEYLDKYLRVFRGSDLGVGKLIVNTKTGEKLKKLPWLSSWDKRRGR